MHEIPRTLSRLIEEKNIHLNILRLDKLPNSIQSKGDLTRIGYALYYRLFQQREKEKDLKGDRYKLAREYIEKEHQANLQEYFEDRASEVNKYVLRIKKNILKEGLIEEYLRKAHSLQVHIDR